MEFSEGFMTSSNTAEAFRSIKIDGVKKGVENIFGPTNTPTPTPTPTPDPRQQQRRNEEE